MSTVLFSGRGLRSGVSVTLARKSTSPTIIPALSGCIVGAREIELLRRVATPLKIDGAKVRTIVLLGSAKVLEGARHRAA